MKRFLLAGTALAAMVSASAAADMPEVAPVEAVVAPYSWSGFYIGVHGGWGWAESGVELNKDDKVLIQSLDEGGGGEGGGGGGGGGGGSWDDYGSFDFETDDFVIGGHVGYNFAIGDMWLIGLEGDFSFTDADDDDENFYGGVEREFLASLRGRVGFAFDRFLVYGTGGAAWAGFKVDYDDQDDENTFFGWVAGGGLEYAVTDNIVLGVEYLHYEFDEEDFDLYGPCWDGLNADLSVDVVRGRLSVKFDSLFD